MYVCKRRRILIKYFNYVCMYVCMYVCTNTSMPKICNSTTPHFTRYILRFNPQKLSAFYPFQHPHVHRSARLHFTIGPKRFVAQLACCPHVRTPLHHIKSRKRLCAGVPVPSSVQACLFLASPMHNGRAATYRI